ncbi:amidase [Streptomyces sp. SAI-135]|uniref:amidase n=1 Tax=unclassified Streptomyces TaxID=2593676 RepID=UPI0024752FB9|nr:MULTISPECIES: amidase family protein [unclassified Streptomyces]MDH6514943.1 amidase [Streptomyces sp. SAI-090]MDH6547128.1 amidase [Streptomyces sp. SAI-041]MDH6588853.1 amidase [Streptomyces sp. SAI-133]MDH6620974.1 amidase [Streptomyces sp. SAI-135]
MTNWVGRTAAEIAAAVREKRATPREVVAEHLARIERLDGRIGAFRVVRAEAAPAEADEVGARGDLGELPLAGVPVAVKDNLAVRGETNRVGSTATPDTPADADHEVVARLRAAGAVVVGLTNVPELCVFGTTEGVHGTSRNPWDTSRTAGGSSGGSAAAVAAGLVPIALGNDGMGSLRIPAANCGLVTLKPGSGVVPAGISDGDWFGMSENGPLATTVEDARLLLSVLADTEFVRRDASATLDIAVSLRSPLAGVTVSAPYAQAVREAAGLLIKAGHQVRRADPPYPLSLGVTSLATWTAGTSVDAQGLDPRLLARRTRVHAAIGRRFVKSVRKGGARQELRERLEPFFAEHDVLVLPALARRSPKAEAWHERGWLRNVLANTAYSPLTPPWNLTGWPAMSVPFGTLPSGAPTAVQLVGRPGSEAVLLGVAEELERRRPWRRTAPLD